MTSPGFTDGDIIHAAIDVCSRQLWWLDISGVGDTIQDHVIPSTQTNASPLQWIDLGSDLFSLACHAVENLVLNAGDHVAPAVRRAVVEGPGISLVKAPGISLVKAPPLHGAGLATGAADPDIRHEAILLAQDLVDWLEDMDTVAEHLSRTVVPSSAAQGRPRLYSELPEPQFADACRRVLDLALRTEPHLHLAVDAAIQAGTRAATAAGRQKAARTRTVPPDRAATGPVADQVPPTHQHDQTRSASQQTPR